MTTPLICVLGDLIEDVVVRPAGPVRYGSDVSATIVRRQGGSAANVARAVAGLGARARFACRVGADPLGDRLVAEMSSARVDVRAEREGRTGSIVVLVDHDGERTMIRDRGSSGEVGLPSGDWLDGADALHLTLYTFEEPPGRATAMAVAAQARTRRIPCSLVLSSVAVLEAMGRPGVDSLLAEACPDIVLANDDEARWLGVTRRPRPELATLVITRGARPALLWQDGQCVDVDAVAGVDAADTTGAGDAFAAGFLVARASGSDLVGSVRAGHKAAASRLARQSRRPRAVGGGPGHPAEGAS